ncbi:MAG: response regulator, partial [Bacteriovorax sp.]|nr:response regulator [Bacteriovorax sp.]
MKKYQILCVDDDNDILPIYKLMLKNLDYEIITYTSCLEAIDYIKENGNEIIYIFSDYSMMEMNGLEFRKKINDLGIDIPFVLVTGHYNLEMTKAGMDLRIQAFVEKPFHEVDLKKLINDLGDKRRSYLDEEHEMVVSFVEESHPMLLEIEDLIMSLESNPDNANLLNTYFRLLHTIKGTA